MGDFTRQITLTTTPQLIAEFDTARFENVTFKADAEFLLFFNGGAGSGMTIAANSIVSFDPTQFRAETLNSSKIVRIFGRVSAGTTTLYYAYMGE